MTPIGLSREQAAAHIGVCPNTFEKLVRAGVMPRPVRIGRRKLWHRIEIEAAFADLPRAPSAPGEDGAGGEVSTEGGDLDKWGDVAA